MKLQKTLIFLFVWFFANICSANTFNLVGVDTIARLDDEPLAAIQAKSITSSEGKLFFSQHSLLEYPYEAAGIDMAISFVFSIREALVPGVYPILRLRDNRTVLSGVIKAYQNSEKHLCNFIRYQDDGKPVICEFRHGFVPGQEYKISLAYKNGEAELRLDDQIMKNKKYEGQFLAGTKLDIGDGVNSLPMSINNFVIESAAIERAVQMNYLMQKNNWVISGNGLTIAEIGDGKLAIHFDGSDDIARLQVKKPVYAAAPKDHIRATGSYRITESEYGSMFRIQLNNIAQRPFTSMSGNRYQKATQQTKPSGEADRFDFSTVASEGSAYYFNIIFYGNPQTMILEETMVKSMPITRTGRPPAMPENRAYDRDEVEKSLRSIKPVRYELRKHPGRVELLLDGKKVSPAIYRRGPHYPHWTRYADFRDAGINLYYFRAGMGKASEAHDMGVHSLWHGKGKYDFSGVAEELRVIHTINPQARVILWLELGIYEDWEKDYPDAVFTNARGEKGYMITTGKTIYYGEDAQKQHLERIHEEFSVAPSYYSDEFRNSVSEVVAALTRFLEEDLTGRIVCGIHVCGGADTQFFPLDRDATRGEDHSPAAKRAWSAYLREKYNHDLSSLRLAWASPAADFDNPGIPGNQERGNDNSGIQPSQRGRDYVLFNSYAHARLRLALYRTIKENSASNRLLTGSYYPPGSTGNYHFDTMLRSPDLDFMVDIVRTTPAGSYQLHNKLYIGEMDIRTPDRMVPIFNYIYPPASFENIVRQAAANITQREGGMYHLFDLSEVYYSNPETVKFFGKVREELDAALDGKLSISPEIAVFIDYQLLAGCSYRSASHLSALISYSTRHILEHSGVPFQVYSIGDIFNPKLNMPGIIFFPLIPDFDEAQIARLRDMAKSAGSVIVWGLHRQFQEKSASSFGGYEFNFPVERNLSPIRVVDAENVGVEAGRILGERYTVTGFSGDYFASLLNPARINAQKNDDVLAVYANDGQPGFIRRIVDGQHEYVNGAPGAFAPEFFRLLARKTGAQILSNSDNLVVMAENGLLSVLCERGGNAKVIVPAGMEIVSCLSGQNYRVVNEELHFEAKLDFEMFYFKMAAKK